MNYDSNEAKKFKAMQLIKKGLEIYFEHELKNFPHENKYNSVSTAFCHEELSKESIVYGVVAFMLFTGLGAGSSAGFNLYRLVCNYLLCPDIREQINKLLKVNNVCG